MNLQVNLIAAFADTPESGNMAGVTLLKGLFTPEALQHIAAEVGFSETAFLLREGDKFKLRWFTPKTEVDICGHATLASAHHLFKEGILKSDEDAVFKTRSGLLKARMKGDMIELDFPADAAKEEDSNSLILSALGIKDPLFFGEARHCYLIEISSYDELMGINPNMNHLGAFNKKAFIVTCKSDKAGEDFVSRVFAPAMGIDEDPVTGSAHCVLGPYWGEKLGMTKMTGYQASKRGGSVGVRLNGDRVFLTGRAVSVSSCEVEL